MADYKDIIEGAVNKVVDKVKDYTDGKSPREICEEGLDKVSGYGKRAMLLLDITGAKEQLRGTYEELGRRYYEKAKNKHAAEYDELFDRIEALQNEIAAKQENADSIKAAGYTTGAKDIEVDIIEYGEVVDNIDDK